MLTTENVFTLLDLKKIVASMIANNGKNNLNHDQYFLSQSVIVCYQ